MTTRRSNGGYLARGALRGRPSLGGGRSAPPQFFTAFAGSNEDPISEGGKWDNGDVVGLDWKGFKVLSNRALVNAFSSDGPNPPGHFNDAIALVKSSAFAATPNQKASILIHRAGGYNPVDSHEQGCFVRSTLAAHSMTGYEAYLNAAGNHAIVRWNGALDDFTPLVSAGVTAPADGDVLSLEMVGTTLISRMNGVVLLTTTDSTYSSGQFGMQGYVMSTSTPANYCPSSFTGQNI